MLSPAMQGVILAIAKARQTFDRDGSEAGLVKVLICLLNQVAWISVYPEQRICAILTDQECKGDDLCSFSSS